MKTNPFLPAELTRPFSSPWNPRRATSSPRARLGILALLAGAGLVLVPPCFALPGSWSATANLHTAHFNHGATLLNDGTVLVEGGAGSAVAEIYNPAQRTWITTGSLSAPRTAHTATLLQNGKVLVAGGFNVVNNNVNSLATAEIYDPATATWSLTGSLNVPRSSAGAVLLANGKVLTVGGGNSTVGVLASAELYDPATGMWTPTGSMATQRVEHTTTLLPDGRVLVTGGSDTGISGSALGSAEIYNPATGTWSSAGNMSVLRAYHTATLLRNGKVLVTGGYASLSGGVLASAELFDPVANSWTLTGSLITKREKHTAVLQTDGTVLVACGTGGDNGNVSSEIYDPASGVWSPTGATLDQRSAHTMTYLPDGTTLIAGGFKDNYGELTSAEIYTPGFAEGTRVSGSGGIATGNGSAGFSMDVKGTSGNPIGSLSYTDVAGSVIIPYARLHKLTVSGNTATITGNAKLDRHQGRVSFTVTAVDNGLDGTMDTYSITMSIGYSAGGTLTSGNVVIQ